MKNHYFILCLTVFLLLPLVVQALPTSGGLYVSIPNASVRCANIVLPDDGGYFGRGSVDYIITMTPDPRETWGDLSYQRVTTDENNTAVIPICFNSFGRPIGNCSKPFTIRISAPSAGVDMSWQGGACASTYADFDTSFPASAPDDSISGLDDADLFSIGFKQAKKHAKPNESSQFILQVESYATLLIDFSVQGQGGIAVNPSTGIVTTNSDNSYHEITFTTDPLMNERTASFEVTTTVRDCGSGSMCSRQATAELIVSQDQQELVGFSANIFPENINLKDLQPVTYRMTIQNMGNSDEFSVDATLSEDLTSTFAPVTITVPQGEYKTITFTVTPNNQSASYELDFEVASSNGIKKPVTAYLSTNELFTDASRSMDLVGQVADSQTASQANQEMDRWYNTYQNSGYGENLDEYDSLQTTLQDARQPGAQPVNGQNGDSGNGDNLDNDTDAGGDVSPALDLFGRDIMLLVTIIVIVACAVLLVVFFFYRKRKKMGIKLDEEINLGEGF
jgi:hypothetical protein